MPDVCPGGNKIYSFPGLVSAWCLGVHLWYLLILVHSEVWVTQCRESPTTVSQPHPAWWLLLYSTKTENGFYSFFFFFLIVGGASKEE